MVMSGNGGVFSDQAFADSQDKVEMKTAQELADLERLSQAYQPDVVGPLVGNLQSSKILEAEYANADEVYVQKTAALSPKYSNYRPVKGDGNCGWRALAFGYFELLLRTGDAAFIEAEKNRIKSMNSYMDSVGMSDYLYEDFVEETLLLLDAIKQSPAIDNPYEDKTLLATFNVEDKSNGIVTHLRLLTSGFLQLFPANYEPFIENGISIREYAASVIEPFGMQIDHLGVKALIELLFIPAGFAVEISYLDRSASDEVNVHRFEDDSSSSDHAAAKFKGKQRSALRLLYRPGHYDLIYKNGDLAPEALPNVDQQSQQSDLQVSMMYGQQYDQQWDQQYSNYTFEGDCDSNSLRTSSQVPEEFISDYPSKHYTNGQSVAWYDDYVCGGYPGTHDIKVVGQLVSQNPDGTVTVRPALPAGAFPSPPLILSQQVLSEPLISLDRQIGPPLLSGRLPEVNREQEQSEQAEMEQQQQKESSVLAFSRFHVI